MEHIAKAERWGKTTTQLIACINAAKRGETIHYVYRAGLKGIRKQASYLCRKFGVSHYVGQDRIKITGAGAIMFHAMDRAPKAKYMPNTNHRIVLDHKAERSNAG